MLVLSRKVGEQIVIGDSIVITVIKIHGSKVRIGIEASKEMKIARQKRITQEPIAGATANEHD